MSSVHSLALVATFDESRFRGVFGDGVRSVAEAKLVAPRNFVVILTEAQGWANTSVAMDGRNPSSWTMHFKTPAVNRLAC